jgi:hypothetical protein
VMARCPRVFCDGNLQSRGAIWIHGVARVKTQHTYDPTKCHAGECPFSYRSCCKLRRNTEGVATHSVAKAAEAAAVSGRAASTSSK